MKLPLIDLCIITLTDCVLTEDIMHKSTKSSFKNISTFDLLNISSVWWQPAPQEDGSSQNFPASHILRPREKKNIVGNPMGKYKTTDAAGILNFYYIFPTIVLLWLQWSNSRNNLFLLECVSLRNICKWKWKFLVLDIIMNMPHLADIIIDLFQIFIPNMPHYCVCQSGKFYTCLAIY